MTKKTTSQQKAQGEQKELPPGFVCKSITKGMNGRIEIVYTDGHIHIIRGGKGQPSG